MDDNIIKLKQVGFFEELEHGNYDGGSLKACIRNQVADGEEKLVELCEDFLKHVRNQIFTLMRKE